MSIFTNESLHVIWKKSQHLNQWKQRQLKFINCEQIATAKQQSVDSWNASFHINIKNIKKLAIYPPDYIKSHFMVMIKIYYGKHTYMADKDWIAFELFMAIIKNKCINSLQIDKLQKHQIKGNKLIHYGSQPILSRFVVFRKDGVLSKAWVKEQMIITNNKLVSYAKMGFGQQADQKGNWHLQIKEVKRILTEFQFYKDCLIIKIYTSVISYDEFAVPIEGEHLKLLVQTLVKCKSE